MNVLVAEDGNVERRVLCGILRHYCGLDSIVQVANGKKAMEALAEQKFDLILLDWIMPPINGIDVLKTIRKTDKETPVIMITGMTERESVVEALNEGASGYIIKPVKATIVAKKVASVLPKD